MKNFWIFLCSLGVGLSFSACKTVENTAEGRADKEQIYLQKGMRDLEVLALLGEPESIKEVQGESGPMEVWVYRESREQMTNVPADTREVPYIHPITREETTITEVVYKRKIDKVTLRTELYIEDGILTGWDEDLRRSTHYED